MFKRKNMHPFYDAEGGGGGPAPAPAPAPTPAPAPQPAPKADAESFAQELLKAVQSATAKKENAVTRLSR
jgi:hypothetical protein